MKKIILFTMLLSLSSVSFSQQTNPSPALTKKDYLQKSKKLNTAAWLMVAGGAALIVTGSIVWGNDESDFYGNDSNEFVIIDLSPKPGVWIVAAGLVAAAGSIPLFIASARNKRKAMSMSFKNERIPLLQNGSFVNRSVPSLSLKISL